jgi:prophage regulatory protein
VSAPDVMGIQEISDRLDVGRSRANQLVREPGFPEPTWLVMGRVWSREDIEKWISEHRPDTPGSPIAR